MKKLFALILLVSFSVAVCHAVPYASGFSPHKTELTKKSFELHACELPALIEVPAAPKVVYDLDVRETTQSPKVVIPQANSPPNSIAKSSN